MDDANYMAAEDTMDGSTVLSRTPYVTLSVLDHPAGRCRVIPRETARDAITFIETGTFAFRPLCAGDDAPLSATQGMLVVTSRGTELARECHQPGSDNRCLTITYSDEIVDGLRSAGLPQLRLSALQLTARQRFLHYRLRALASAAAHDRNALRLELIAGSLLESVLCARLNTGRAPPPPPAAMRRIARTAELIESDYARPLKLTDLAFVAQMSAYHFARSFASLVGIPPHKYLVAVRLREAVRLMLDGASVTAAAYEVGFSSPSHFTVAFRQRYGIVPSALMCGQRALDIGPWGRRRGHLQPAALTLAKGA